MGTKTFAHFLMSLIFQRKENCIKMMTLTQARRLPAAVATTTSRGSNFLFSTVSYADVAIEEEARDAEKKEKKCPFTGWTAASRPELKEVPTLPFFGSVIHQYSGTPAFNPKELYSMREEMRKRFGRFYSFGAPGIGKGLHGTVHSIVDPDEMLKVVRNEGTHPSGIVQALWTFIGALKEEGSALIDGADNGLLGQGERWKKQRTFFQTGMLSPQAAKGFIPGIVSAAELASKGAPNHQGNDLNRYVNLCAFDMLCTCLFGELTRCADPPAAAYTTATNNNEENANFCMAAIKASEKSSKLMHSPYECIMHQIGYKTKAYKEFLSSWKTTRKIGKDKLLGFIDRYERGDLNKVERSSYFAKALDRAEGSGLNREEMLELCLIALFVGVDTTSSVIGWNLIHLALNPKVQSKLYDELSKVVDATASGGGRITTKTLEKKTSPYLHAIIRETYRITPPFANTVKTITKSEVDVHGVTLPKESVVLLENIFTDPNYLSDAKEFKPERWLPEAVRSRVGTDMETMDHPVLRDTFGQGARRCPGSRVATNEIMIMIAQLVLDYEIVSPDVKRLSEVPYDLNMFLTPDIPALVFHPRQRREKID